MTPTPPSEQDARANRAATPAADPARRWTPVALPPDAGGAPVPPPKGAYSPAVRAGDFVFVSGQVPRDPATGALVGDDVAAQTRQTLANLRRVLEAAGATLADVVSVAVHLAHADDWGAFDAAYRETFAPPFPTRTAVGAELRGILVEITAVAYAPVGAPAGGPAGRGA
jgi:2-iminobutanoate/2-iminopropanoate deaminase